MHIRDEVDKLASGFTIKPKHFCSVTTWLPEPYFWRYAYLQKHDSSQLASRRAPSRSHSLHAAKLNTPHTYAFLQRIQASGADLPTTFKDPGFLNTLTNTRPAANQPSNEDVRWAICQWVRGWPGSGGIYRLGHHQRDLELCHTADAEAHGMA